MASLQSACRAALATAGANAKAAAARALAGDWRDGRLSLGEAVETPARPARPARPVLALPRAVPKRKVTTQPEGRIALLHALAHIEFNAVDLALDILARFGTPDLPRGFFDDWVRVADEEGRHFGLLADRLADLGAAYGDLPAHDGLWQAAEATAGDLLARLAVVPLVLEARGLDVTPAMIARLTAAGDGDSAALLEIIYQDEIGHVAIGRRWFDHVAQRRGLEPESTWLLLVRRHFKGALKPPFNHVARAAAGLRQASYEALTRESTG